MTQDLQLILGNFHLKITGKIQQNKNGTNSENFLVKTNRGYFFVKKHENEVKLDDVLCEADILEKLQKNNFPVIAYSKTKEDLPYFLDEKNTIWTVCKKIDGRHPTIEEFEKITPQITVLFAKMHQILEFKKIKSQIIFEDYILELWHEKKLKKEITDFLIYALIPFQNLTFGFVHGDIHEKNIILGKDGQIYFLDFGSLQELPVLYDIAILIVKIVYENENINEIFSDKIWTKYISGFAEIKNEATQKNIMRLIFLNSLMRTIDFTFDFGAESESAKVITKIMKRSFEKCEFTENEIEKVKKIFVKKLDL